MSVSLDSMTEAVRCRAGCLTYNPHGNRNRQKAIWRVYILQRVCRCLSGSTHIFIWWFFSFASHVFNQPRWPRMQTAESTVAFKINGSMGESCIFKIKVLKRWEVSRAGKKRDASQVTQCAGLKIVCFRIVCYRAAPQPSRNICICSVLTSLDLKQMFVVKPLCCSWPSEKKL